MMICFLFLILNLQFSMSLPEKSLNKLWYTHMEYFATIKSTIKYYATIKSAIKYVGICKCAYLHICIYQHII